MATATAIPAMSSRPSESGMAPGGGLWSVGGLSSMAASTLRRRRGMIRPSTKVSGERRRADFWRDTTRWVEPWTT